MNNPVHSALGALDIVDGKRLIVTKVGESGWPLYGPYVDLPPGIYSVEFQISAAKVSPTIGYDEICGLVDVSTDTGLQVLAKKEFSPADLAKGGSRVLLSFNVEVPGCYEFRVFTNGKVGLVIQQDRKLTMDRDYFQLFDCVGSSSPEIVENVLTVSEFFLQNISHFKDLVAKGATVVPEADGAVVTLDGFTLHVQNVEDFQVILEVIVRNDYNFIMNSPVCVIDVGMNVGIASLYFAKLPFVKEVHSFEPFKAPFDRAIANFKLNSEFANKITAHNVGLSDQTVDSVVLYNDIQTIGVSTRGAGHGIPSSISILDAADVFSEIIARSKSNGLSVVVKLDCEGSEFPIFETLAKRGLLPEVSVYLIEWHKWWSEAKTQWDLIKPLLANNFVVLDQTDLSNPHAGPIYAVKMRS